MGLFRALQPAGRAAAGRYAPQERNPSDRHANSPPFGEKANRSGLSASDRWVDASKGKFCDKCERSHTCLLLVDDTIVVEPFSRAGGIRRDQLQANMSSTVEDVEVKQMCERAKLDR